jgi:hypothetical protein
LVSSETSIQLWNVALRRNEQTYNAHLETVSYLKMFVDNSKFISTSISGGIII